MPRESQPKAFTHGDEVVRVITQPLPATKALKLLTRLTTMVGETILVLAARGGDGLEDMDADTLRFTVRALINRMDEDVVDATVKEALQGMQAEGVGDVVQHFDSFFQGRMMLLFDCLQYALEINYRDFFDALRSRTNAPSEAERPTG